MSTIKIVSGFLGGRIIKTIRNKNLKPTPARVREQIFSWLRPMKEDIVCLDLFAGSGSLGIEALSNGAKKVVFIEQNQELYNTLYKNPKIKLLKFKEAELTKLLVNTYLTTKISYSNFVKNLCKDFQDVSDLRVLETIGLDARIGTKFMLPGGPYSGPCLPRDNLSLKKFCLDNNVQNSFY